MFGTGAAWLALDTLGQRDGPLGPTAHPAQPALLAIHGVLAMGMMMIFGGLLATHVRHHWRKRRHRATGSALLLAWCLLMASAGLLYYASNESVRAAAHRIHVVLGLGLPAAVALHVAQRLRDQRRGRA